MKLRESKQKIMTILLTLALPFASVSLSSITVKAQVQGPGADGGNLEELRPSLKDLLNSELLITVLQAFHENYDSGDLYNFNKNGPALSARFNKFRWNTNLYKEINAIKENKFNLTERCYETDDQGNEVEVDASTKSNEPLAPICINVKKIKEGSSTIKFSELIGLIIHEIAHHYGDKDEDHTLGYAVREIAHLSIMRAKITYEAANSNYYRSSLCDYMNFPKVKNFIIESGVTNDLCSN